MDIETRIESLIARVVNFGHESDLAMKKTCLVAAEVVGTYSGTTAEIAKRMRRSVSSVENWAHAAKLYQELRKINCASARYLWRSLPASHWWLAWDIQRAGYDALHYLTYAEGHFWSGRDMMQEYRRDIEAGNAPMQIKRAKLAFYGMANELWKQRKHLTFEQIRAIEEVSRTFGGEE